MSTIAEITSKLPTTKGIIKRINGVAVTIKGIISVDDFYNIVQTVAQSCFQEDGYRPENREIVSRFAILKYLTDIEVGDEDDIAAIFSATQNGTWYADIAREVVKLPVWAEVEQAIDRMIDYKIATQPNGFDKLCTDLSAILSADTQADLADVKQILDGLNKVDKKAFVSAVTENVIEKTAKDKKKSTK